MCVLVIKMKVVGISAFPIHALALSFDFHVPSRLRSTTSRRITCCWNQINWLIKASKARAHHHLTRSHCQLKERYTSSPSRSDSMRFYWRSNDKFVASLLVQREYRVSRFVTTTRRKTRINLAWKDEGRRTQTVRWNNYATAESHKAPIVPDAERAHTNHAISLLAGS